MHLSEHIKLKTDEKIVFFLRRHWLVFTVDIVIVAFLSIMPLAAYAFFGRMQPEVMQDPVWKPVIALLASAYYLTVWAVFLTKFVDYYLDSWIVTDDRILDIQQRGLFSRTISELDLAKVQDVTSEVKGVIRSIFDYGNVSIQTAGEVEHFIFEEVPHPHKIRERIIELIDADRIRHRTMP